MLMGDALHQIHDELIMVVGQVDILKDRSQLELIGGHLVVACLHRDAQLQALYLEILHESRDTWRDAAEVVVVQLLVFGRRVSHQRTSCEEEVGTGIIECLIHEEILLLPT